MAVKQVFETYVYDPGLSSVGQMPFVLTQVSQARRGLAGCLMDLRKSRMSQYDCGSWLACDAGAMVYRQYALMLSQASQLPQREAGVR